METMYITRTINGKAEHIELTEDEQLACLGIVRRNFYRNEISMNYPNVKENEIEDIVWEAHYLYCEGDGYTEYEALELTLSNWGY